MDVATSVSCLLICAKMHNKFYKITAHLSENNVKIFMNFSCPFSIYLCMYVHAYILCAYIDMPENVACVRNEYEAVANENF